MRYKDLTVESFRSLLLSRNKNLQISISNKGAGGEEHWRITGGLSVVEWWPWSKRETAYNKGTGRSYHFPSIEEVICMTSHTPKKRKSVKVLDLKCPECGGQMLLRTIRDKSRRFYSCSKFPQCRGSHGYHPDGTPLGVPADQETKNLRIQAHEAFDRQWELRKMTRAQAYTWLSVELGIERVKCHIASFDKMMCNRVILACKAWESPPQLRLVEMSGEQNKND